MGTELATFRTKTMSPCCLRYGEHITLTCEQGTGSSPGCCLTTQSQGITLAPAADIHVLVLTNTCNHRGQVSVPSLH